MKPAVRVFWSVMYKPALTYLGPDGIAWLLGVSCSSPSGLRIFSDQY
jgi:hypothetical protein